MHSKLQYISQGDTAQAQLQNIQQALDAGCQWIQLRFKQCSPGIRQEVAEQAKTNCEQYNATFIVNDHIDIAKAVNADGVHLGLNDTPVTHARKILGPHKIIGGTANTLEDVFQRVGEKCDYVGVGPFRFTDTKEKLSPVLGLIGYQNIMTSLEAHNIRIPIYAIGGILADDLEALVSCGVYGVAISGMITRHENKIEIIQLLNQKLYAIF
jgi:thiamine-phosphate pyrophosphorylase